MSSQASQSQLDTQKTTSADQSDEASLPGIFQDKYNTVYERIMQKTGGDNGVPVVVACVAYSLYKEEKRQWIVQRQQELGRRPRKEEIDGYVTGCTDLRINSLLTQARDIIGAFARDLLESSKEELRDEIYRRQFEGLHDQLRGASDLMRTNTDSLVSHITDKTKPAWWTSIGQNLVANFFWTVIVVFILVSLNLGFDFNNFGKRINAFFNPPVEKTN